MLKKAWFKQSKERNHRVSAVGKWIKFSTNLRNSSDLIVWTYRNTRQILIVLVSVTTCCWFTLDHGHLPLNKRPPRQVRICQSFPDRPPVGWTHGAEAIKNPKPRYTTESNLFEPLQAGLKANKFNIPVQYCKAGKVSPSVFAWKGRAATRRVGGCLFFLPISHAYRSWCWCWGCLFSASIRIFAILSISLSLSLKKLLNV